MTSIAPRLKGRTSVFTTILGIPAHPLIVHAAVVFIPLQVISAIVYAFVPAVRHRIDWAVIALLVIGPAAAFAARQSGRDFRARLIHNGLKNPDLLARIDTHMNFGDALLWSAITLGVLTIAMLLLVRYRAHSAPAGTLWIVLGWVVNLATLGIALATGYYVFRTGDTGAHLVWQGV